MNKLIDTINKYNMIETGDRVLCALSGGADSVSMVHMLAGCATSLGITLAAAHFSHGLRPEAAQSELELCRRLCQQLGIELFHENGDTGAFCTQEGVGMEEGARQLRYDFLHRIALIWGADKIATAHNSGDNAETILLNLARGAGGQGLMGIPPVRGAIIRPILEISRKEIEAYNAENLLEYATDYTNAQSDYGRNKIRNIVMPILEQINSAAMENINSAAELLRIQDDYLSKASDFAIKNAEITSHGTQISASLLASEHEAIAARIVRKISPVRLEKSHIKAVLALCRGDSPSAQASLPKEHIACRINDAIYIGQQIDKALPPPAVLELDRPVIWGDFEIIAHSGQCNTPYDSICYISQKGELSVRSRRTGDSFFLRGCTKNVKKYMIDIKIPQKNRDRIPIICNNKEVVAVLWGKNKPFGECTRAVTARRISSGQ